MTGDFCELYDKLADLTQVDLASRPREASTLLVSLAKFPPSQDPLPGYHLLRYKLEGSGSAGRRKISSRAQFLLIA